MYVDDTVLYCCGEDLWNIQNDLQFDLCRVQDWLWANRLQLNFSKSVIMLIGSWQKLQNQSVSVFINGKALASVTSTCQGTRYLGVLIDQHLTWKLHVANILEQIRSKLYALYRLRPLPGHLLFWLYRAFFYHFLITVMLFGNPLWYHFQKPLECLYSCFLQQVIGSNSFIKLTLSECCCFHSAGQFSKFYITFVWIFEKLVCVCRGRNKHCLFIPQINNYFDWKKWIFLSRNCDLELFTSHFIYR